jgi:mevalonate kinase
MFPAKLLLFGEYSLMHGSKALAIPFPQYSGNWSEKGGLSPINDKLLGFVLHLEQYEAKASFRLDIKKLKSEILTEGLFFDSTIPMSYGVGSSGALCAAFYHRYVIDPIPTNCNEAQLPELRTHLSELESYFHGTSSGIDPLVSYTKSPILIAYQNNVQRLERKAFSHGTYLFLIDTNDCGDTKVNVKFFEKMLKTGHYLDKLKEQYNPLVDNCISSFLKNDMKSFLSCSNKLTTYQQIYFKPMINIRFLKYFKHAADTGDFSLKICGSGGGGFILGFTTDIDHVKDYFLSEGIDLIVPEFNYTLTEII